MTMGGSGFLVSDVRLGKNQATQIRSCETDEGSLKPGAVRERDQGAAGHMGRLRVLRVIFCLLDKPVKFFCFSAGVLVVMIDAGG